MAMSRLVGPPAFVYCSSSSYGAAASRGSSSSSGGGGDSVFSVGRINSCNSSSHLQRTRGPANRIVRSRRVFAPAICSAAVQSSEQTLTEAPDVEAELSDRAAAWKLFVERVSGEWDGYGADFNRFGEPFELPSQVVPDAFRDWGLEVHDWQTMCPTLGQEQLGSLGYKVIRLLPTVGCEADAATQYCTEEKDFGTALCYAFHTNGSYTAVWPGRRVTRSDSHPGRTEKVVARDTDRKNEWEVEHCLVIKDRNSSRNRARILQQVTVDEDTSSLHLQSITVYFEDWDGPFRNGESLGGCSISGSGFAKTEALDLNGLAGSWQVNSFFAREEEPSPKALTLEATKVMDRTDLGGQMVTLPKNLWSSIRTSGEAGSYIIEAGCLVNPDQNIVSSLEFLPSGNIQASNISFGKRV